MNTEKHEGRKLFLTAFSMSLILLSLAMVSTVAAVQPAMPSAEKFEDEYIYQPSASDTLTVIVVGLSGDIPKEFLLIRYNPQYGQIPLVLLPAQTIIKDKTLAEIYTKNGLQALKQDISEYFGIIVDRYVSLNGNLFMRIAGKIGSISYELPEEISYTKKGYPVRFTAGRQQLDAQDMLDLFMAPALRDPMKKSALLGDIIATGINQNMSAASDKRASGIFKLAINAVHTDINYADFELRRQSADFLAQMDYSYAGNLPIQGKLEEKGFIISEDFVELVHKYFQML